jgi:hypothetical protein
MGKNIRVQGCLGRGLPMEHLCLYVGTGRDACSLRKRYTGLAMLDSYTRATGG